MRALLLSMLPAAVVTLSGCAPALDWREVSFEAGEPVRLLFPCRPEQLRREVGIGARRLPARMLVCDAGARTWSATELVLADPEQTEPVLMQMRHSLGLNLTATEEPLPAAVQGRAAGAHLRGVLLRGQRPGGATVTAQALFFARGPRLYQLVVLGPDEPERPAAAAEPVAAQFFEGTRWLTLAAPAGSIR